MAKKTTTVSKKKVDAELKKEQERAEKRSQAAVDGILERLSDKQVKELVDKYPRKDFERQLKFLHRFNKKLSKQDPPGPILTLTGIVAVIRRQEKP